MRLAFHRFGESDATNVVILHGLLGSKRNWFGFGKSLSDLGFNVWLVDQRNHGESEWNDKHTYFDLAEDIKKFFEAHGIKNSYLIGHSMGGKAAMVFDKVYQGHVSKLIVVDIAPITYPPIFENYLKVLSELDLSGFKYRSEIDLKLSEYFEDKSFRSFLMQNLKLDDRKNFHWRVNLTSLLSNVTAISEFPFINSISNTNSLFLYGDLSEYGVAEHSDTIKENFPISELVPVTNAGHWIHVEQPSKFLEIVSNFLKSD